MKKMSFTTYEYGSLKLDVFANMKDSDISHYTFEYDGEEFGQIYGSTLPSEETVVELAMKEVIPKAEKDARNLLSIAESPLPDRVAQIALDNHIELFELSSEEDCYKLQQAIGHRLKAIHDAQKLIGKLYTNLVCTDCGINFDIRTHGAVEWCVPCYEERTGKKSHATDYKEHMKLSKINV